MSKCAMNKRTVPVRESLSTIAARCNAVSVCRAVARAGLVMLMTLCPLAGAYAAATIYVSPVGNDSNSGNAEAQAVATLNRAVRLAEAVPANAGKVSIRIGGGHYVAQHFETAGNPNGVAIDISGAPDAPAVFDGNGEGGVWMTLVPRHGQPSNLTIENLEVTNYETAIDAKGDRNIAQDWAGGMTIHHNRFINIGDIAKNGAEPSTAAIRLVNSSRNTIVRNEFEHIRNRQSCDLLHGLYVAHHSTGNLIENNYFEDACGDAIRFRDESNSNTVRGNTFKDAWYHSPVSDWFCDKSKRNDCTKISGECPSIGNVLEKNKVIVSGKSPAKLFIPWGDPPANCPAGQRAALL
jgi:hypothetical protein